MLCPTRWTVRANALASIIENHVVLQDTWDKALEVSKDTDSKAKINGVSAQMKKFLIFCSVLYLVKCFCVIVTTYPKCCNPKQCQQLKGRK